MLEVIDQVWADARADATVFKVLRKLRDFVASNLDPPTPPIPPRIQSPTTTSAGHLDVAITTKKHTPALPAAPRAREEFSCMTLTVPALKLPLFLLARSQVPFSKWESSPAPDSLQPRLDKATPAVATSTQKPSMRAMSSVRGPRKAPAQLRATSTRNSNALPEAYLVQPLVRATPMSKPVVRGPKATIIQATLEPTYARKLDNNSAKSNGDGHIVVSAQVWQI